MATTFCTCHRHIHHAVPGDGLRHHAHGAPGSAPRETQHVLWSVSMDFIPKSILVDSGAQISCVRESAVDMMERRRPSKLASPALTRKHRMQVGRHGQSQCSEHHWHARSTEVHTILIPSGHHGTAHKGTTLHHRPTQTTQIRTTSVSHRQLKLLPQTSHQMGDQQHHTYQVQQTNWPALGGLHRRTTVQTVLPTATCANVQIQHCWRLWTSAYCQGHMLMNRSLNDKATQARRTQCH